MSRTREQWAMLVRSGPQDWEVSLAIADEILAAINAAVAGERERLIKAIEDFTPQTIAPLEIARLARRLRYLLQPTPLSTGRECECSCHQGACPTSPPFCGHGLCVQPPPAAECETCEGHRKIVGGRPDGSDPCPDCAVDKELGRFGWHPDPAIDFCVEVDALLGEYEDYLAKYRDITKKGLQDRIFKAMQFTVGGDEHAVAAKNKLRQLEVRLGQPQPPPAKEEGK